MSKKKQIFDCRNVNMLGKCNLSEPQWKDYCTQEVKYFCSQTLNLLLNTSGISLLSTTRLLIFLRKTISLCWVIFFNLELFKIFLYFDIISNRLKNFKNNTRNFSISIYPYLTIIYNKDSLLFSMFTLTFFSFSLSPSLFP